MVIYRKLSSKDNKVYYKRYIRCCCNSAIYNDTNEHYYKNNNYSSIGFYGNHMACVEEQDIDRLLANPPEKVEIEVKYKIAVTVMELRFWLKDCESPI